MTLKEHERITNRIIKGLSNGNYNNPNKTDFLSFKDMVMKNDMYLIFDQIGMNRYRAIPFDDKKYRAKRTPKNCFQNAFQLSQDNFRELTYCEGLCSMRKGDIPLYHAFCIDRDGNVIDPTWSKMSSWNPNDCIYYGIPITPSQVHSVLMKTIKKDVNMTYDIILNYFENGLHKI